MGDVTLGSIIRIPSKDPARAGKYDRIVFYRPAEGGQLLNVTIPDEGFTEAAVKEAIRKDLALVSALKGKTLSL